MKKVFFLIIVFCISCGNNKEGLTEIEKHTLSLQIEALKRNAAIKYKNDSLENDSKNFGKYYGRHNADTLMKLGAKMFAHRWNDPYEIAKDSTLTLEEYLKWCKAHGYDPLTKIDYLK